jgi:hypothetical protein
MTPNLEQLLCWARNEIYWYGAPPPLPKPSEPLGADLHEANTNLWNVQSALVALRQWLNASEQSGVFGELQVGLAQLGWDTPSSAGRRLISEVLWNTYLARFNVSPALKRPTRRQAYSAKPLPELVVCVHDAPHGHEAPERSGWVVEVRLASSHLEPYEHGLEWVLNATLFHDVELGLSHTPLYRRRHRPEDVHIAPEVANGAEHGQPPNCPHCQAVMIPKRRRRNGAPFWGCPTFPSCRGARPWGQALPTTHAEDL